MDLLIDQLYLLQLLYLINNKINNNNDNHHKTSDGSHSERSIGAAARTHGADLGADQPQDGA